MSVITHIPPHAARVARVMRNPIGRFDVADEIGMDLRLKLVEDFITDCAANSQDPQLKATCQQAVAAATAAKTAASAVYHGNLPFYRGYEQASAAMEEFAKLLNTLDPEPAITRQELLDFVKETNARWLKEMRNEFGYMEGFDRNLPGERSGGLSTDGIMGWLKENQTLVIIAVGVFVAVWWMKKGRRRKAA